MQSGRRSSRVRVAAISSLALASACTRGGSSDAPTAGSATSLSASARGPVAKGAGATDAPRDSVVIDFLGSADDCSFGHRGVLLDLGDVTTRSRLSGTRVTAPDVEVREREGASWVGVRSRSLEISFVSSAELKSDGGVVVEARGRGGLAKSASAYLNGRPIGTLAFKKGEPAVVSARAQGSVARGANELLLRFNGSSRGSHELLAELDWIRVGPNDGDAPYSAPTRSDALTTASIAGTARRSVSLRAPGFARCSAFVPNGSVLEGFVGVTSGEADAEVRVLVDRAEPRVVGSFHLGGPGRPPGWQPVSLPLGDIGTIAGVELVAKTSSKGARVAFADARVVSRGEEHAPTAEDTAAAPKARGVIVVAMGSTSRRLLALHGGSIQMPELERLAKDGGVLFEAHRATSSYASGALGSMLTGLSPREHGASEAEAPLSPSAFTVAEAARQAGIVTAMFTANPSTTAPFGFARGWETFAARLPGEDAPTAALFDDVGRWLDAHKDERFLVVVHARGGHPPWDVTSEELKELPPAGYAGGLEPKHAGQALAKARKAGGGRLFTDADRERAFALHGKALVAQDAALGALVARVRSMGRDKDTVWIVTGDVGVDAAAHVPFLEEESLEEGALSVPLVVRGPTKPPSERVSTPTSGVDVARTILDAFGLPPPPHLGGRSLWTIAAQERRGADRPLIALTTTRFSARWGPFALVGTRERETKLCSLSLDPDCASDVRPSHPLAAEVLHSLVWQELVGKKRGPDSGSRDGRADPRPELKGTAPAPPGFGEPRPTPSKALDTSNASPVGAAGNSAQGPRVIPDGPTSTALRAWGR